MTVTASRRSSQRSILRSMIVSLQMLISISECVGTSEGSFVTVAWPAGSHHLHQHHLFLSSNLLFAHTSDFSLSKQCFFPHLRGVREVLGVWKPLLQGDESSIREGRKALFWRAFWCLACISVPLQIILHFFKVSSQGFSWQPLGSADFGHHVDSG